MRIAFLTATAVLMIGGGAASAVEVTETVAYSAPAKAVWTKASPDFCGIGTWHPAVESCKLADGGATRTLSLKGGGEILEKRTAWDADGFSYSYEIVESPLPVSNYKSTFVVKPDGEKSSVTWSSTFEPKGADEATAKKAISGIYTSGLQALQGKL